MHSIVRSTSIGKCKYPTALSTINAGMWGQGMTNSWHTLCKVHVGCVYVCVCIHYECDMPKGAAQGWGKRKRSFLDPARFHEYILRGVAGCATHSMPLSANLVMHGTRGYFCVCVLGLLDQLLLVLTCAKNQLAPCLWGLGLCMLACRWTTVQVLWKG